MPPVQSKALYRPMQINVFACLSLLIALLISVASPHAAWAQVAPPAEHQLQGQPAGAPAPHPAPVSHAAPAPPAQPEAPAIPAEWAGDTTVNDILPVLPGQVRSMTITSTTGKERRYLLSVTHAYNPNKAAPVLFGFGGWQDTPENFRSYARMGSTNAVNEAIVIYPEGLERSWEGAPYAVSAPGEDIAFIRQLIDVVDRDYRIDRNRIYATGMSNGGGMTAVLGCHAQDLFAGVAMVSAAYYNPVEIGCAQKSIPVLMIHGTDDKLTHYNGGTLHNRPYLPVQTVLGGYASRNACAPVDPAVHGMSGAAQRIVYQGCAAPTEHIKINGADHSWNYDPDVANELWNFLSAQSKKPA